MIPARNSSCEPDSAFVALFESSLIRPLLPSHRITSFRTSPLRLVELVRSLSLSPCHYLASRQLSTAPLRTARYGDKQHAQPDDAHQAVIAPSHIATALFHPIILAPWLSVVACTSIATANHRADMSQTRGRYRPSRRYRIVHHRAPPSCPRPPTVSRVASVWWLVHIIACRYLDAHPSTACCRSEGSGRASRFAP